MASTTYKSVANTLVPYIGDDRTNAMLLRQMERCGADPESFSSSHLKEVRNFIIGATTMYVTDKDKRGELKDKLLSLA